MTGQREWLAEHGAEVGRHGELRAAVSRRRSRVAQALAADGEHPQLGSCPERGRHRREWLGVAGQLGGWEETWGQPFGADLPNELGETRRRAAEEQATEVAESVARLPAPGRGTGRRLGP
ncbi:MAG: hypothetical protein ACRD0J_08630 [Acidimicrobiales bacterium]